MTVELLGDQDDVEITKLGTVALGKLRQEDCPEFQVSLN